MLLQSHLSHDGSVVDLLGAAYSLELHCHYNSHDCKALNNILFICCESLVLLLDISQTYGQLWIYSASPKWDRFTAGILSRCRFGSGKNLSFRK